MSFLVIIGLSCILRLSGVFFFLLETTIDLILFAFSSDPEEERDSDYLLLFRISSLMLEEETLPEELELVIESDSSSSNSSNWSFIAYWAYGSGGYSDCFNCGLVALYMAAVSES